MRAVGVLAAVAVLGGVCACAPRAEGDRVRVVAAFYPLQVVAERVGGGRVEVSNLVRPGAEPHDMELQPSQVAAITDADLVLYLSGFQPAVDDVVDQQPAGRTLDVARVTPLMPAENGKDPHVWLDPTRLSTIGTEVARRLAAADPGHAGEYQRGAQRLAADLGALDREYQQNLLTCDRREIVTSHAAFGYLAARYHLRQVAVSGLSPEEEASPARLAEVARAARETGATTIFFETLVSNRVAQTVADEVGAKAAVLDPVEGLSPGSADDYFSIMRSNLVTLRSALGCR